jgi:hypothetical protein
MQVSMSKRQHAEAADSDRSLQRTRLSDEPLITRVVTFDAPDGRSKFGEVVLPESATYSEFYLQATKALFRGMRPYLQRQDAIVMMIYPMYGRSPVLLLPTHAPMHPDIDRRIRRLVASVAHFTSGPDDLLKALVAHILETRDPFVEIRPLPQAGEQIDFFTTGPRINVSVWDSGLEVELGEEPMLCIAQFTPRVADWHVWHVDEPVDRTDEFFEDIRSQTPEVLEAFLIDKIGAYLNNAYMWVKHGNGGEVYFSGDKATTFLRGTVAVAASRRAGLPEPPELAAADGEHLRDARQMLLNRGLTRESVEIPYRNASYMAGYALSFLPRMPEAQSEILDKIKAITRTVKMEQQGAEASSSAAAAAAPGGRRKPVKLKSRRSRSVKSRRSRSVKSKRNYKKKQL